MTTTLEPGLIFVIGLLILAGNLFALYAVIRLAVTHALDVQRKRARESAKRDPNEGMGYWDPRWDTEPTE